MYSFILRTLNYTNTRPPLSNYAPLCSRSPSMRRAHSSSCPIISRTCCRLISKLIVPFASSSRPPSTTAHPAALAGCRHCHTIVASCSRRAAKLLEPSTQRTSQSMARTRARSRALNSLIRWPSSSARRVHRTSSTDCCRSAGRWAKCWRSSSVSSRSRRAWRRHRWPM